MTVNQFRGIFEWHVGRFLYSDVTRWRIPSIVLRAFGGLFLSGLVLAFTVPLLTRGGAHLKQPFAWLVMMVCVTLCVAPELRRLLRRRG